MAPPPGMGFGGAPGLPRAPPAAVAPAVAAAPAAPVVDTAALFLRPGRLGRPERIAIILRGLPGSGKLALKYAKQQ
jgi:hypothetical protein